MSGDANWQCQHWMSYSQCTEILVTVFRYLLYLEMLLHYYYYYYYSCWKVCTDLSLKSMTSGSTRISEPFGSKVKGCWIVVRMNDVFNSEKYKQIPTIIVFHRWRVWLHRSLLCSKTLTPTIQKMSLKSTKKNKRCDSGGGLVSIQSWPWWTETGIGCRDSRN